MSTTAGQIITRVRRKLNDVISGSYQWTDTELLSYVDAGQKAIFDRRPDSILTDSDTITAQFSLTDIDSTSDVLEVADRFATAIVEYVCACANENSAIEADINRGAYHRKMFETLI